MCAFYVCHNKATKEIEFARFHAQVYERKSFVYKFAAQTPADSLNWGSDRDASFCPAFAGGFSLPAPPHSQYECIQNTEQTPSRYSEVTVFM